MLGQGFFDPSFKLNQVRVDPYIIQSTSGSKHNPSNLEKSDLTYKNLRTTMF